MDFEQLCDRLGNKLKRSRKVEEILSEIRSIAWRSLKQAEAPMQLEEIRRLVSSEMKGEENEK